MRKVAILCAGGLGDGLLMMVAAHRFKSMGDDVTVYHEQHAVLSPLFPEHTFRSYPEPSLFYRHFTSYDLILVENDNSAKAWRLIELRKKNLLSQLLFLFPTPCKASTGIDFVFHPKKPFLLNLQRFLDCYAGQEELGLNNGIEVKAGEKKSFLIAIHPTSNDPLRNWPRARFYKLAQALEARGYEVAFTMSAQERSSWTKELPPHYFPELNNLTQTAQFLTQASFFIGNDSGLGHLASNLQIPTLTISGNPKRVQLWRPAWTLGQVITLPYPLPNFKGIGLRFRDHFWQSFITGKQVERAFNALVTARQGS